GVRMPVLGPLFFLFLLIAFATGGAVIAVRTRLADRPRIRQTANAMIVLLPATGAVVTAMTIGFAWAVDYTTDPLTVSAEAAIIVSGVIGASLLARWWSLRNHGRQNTDVAA